MDADTIKFLFHVGDIVRNDPTRSAAKRLLVILKENGWHTTKDVPIDKRSSFLQDIEQASYTEQAVS